MLYLHIGFHKTGTTYLQKEVFKKVFSNSDEFYYKNIEDRNELNEWLSLEYFLNRYCERKFSKYLYSNESIIQKNKLDFDFFSNAQKLSEILKKKNIENFKILITVRRQKEIIQSLYKDSLGWGYHHLSFKEFIKKFDYFVNIFDYNMIYQKFSKIFGKSKIEIIFFENFTKNKNFEDFENIFQKKFNYKDFQKKYINENISNSSAFLIFLYYKIFKFKPIFEINHKIDNSMYVLLKSYKFKIFFRKFLENITNFTFYLLISKYLDKFIKHLKIKIFNSKDIDELGKKFEKSNKELSKYFLNCPRNYFIQDK